jgi:hypothetical protein
LSEAAIRAKIYEKLSAVSGIGKVYDYERWNADWGQFISYFHDATSKRILGWEICRRNAPASYDSNAEETTKHTFVIRGYMGVKDQDATEKLFNALIEAVREAFRLDFTLGGLCEMAGPVSADIIDTRSFAGVLCHYCELSLPAQELNN